MKKLAKRALIAAAATLALAATSIPAALVSSARAAEISGGYADRSINYSNVRHSVRYAWQRDFPYVRGVNGDGDPFAPGSGSCSFGSYVACFYAGTFCWQRCY